MNTNLFNRSLGVIGTQTLQRAETTRLLDALQAAPNVKFDSRYKSSKQIESHNDQEEASVTWAHRQGVNSLAIDRFEGRFMLSGGLDASILMWDLEKAENNLKRCVHQPISAVKKSNASHKYGITHLSFYPFDSLAFLSSSYDHTLKIYSAETLEISASFDLSSVVYSHALSPIASHLLVACATQHPAVRLVDLRSGASSHSLVGHSGAVLSVAWSPRQEHILASGDSDGVIQLWDIRRSAGGLGTLDMEDSIGVVKDGGHRHNARTQERGKSHIGACNGISWTDDGVYLVSTGHDQRVRVWNIATGANELSHFGPIIKNSSSSTLLPLLVPGHITAPGKQALFYPNEKDVLMFDLFQGVLLKRLRVPGAVVAQARGGSSDRNIRTRITSLVWRSGNVEVYSAHTDGAIRAWLPWTKEDENFDAENRRERADSDNEDDERRKKRRALEGVYRDLTKQKITFT